MACGGGGGGGAPTRFADVGCDHGWLALGLAAGGGSVLATEKAAKPLQLAERHRAAAPEAVSSLVELRRGDGLAPISRGEAEVVVVAGMGSALMRSIVTGGRTTAAELGVRRLVLQPPSWDAPSTRRWLWDAGWRVTDETLLVENGWLNYVVSAERREAGDDADELDPADELLGPVLRHQPPNRPYELWVDRRHAWVREQREVHSRRVREATASQAESVADARRRLCRLRREELYLLSATRVAQLEPALC